MTLFELKQTMKTLQDAITADAAWIQEHAGNPETTMDEINAKTAHRDEMQARYELVKKEHDAMEDKQRASVAMQAGKGAGMTEKDVQLKTKAAYYRAKASGDKAAIEKAYTALGAIPGLDTELGNGSKLLPTTLSNELIVDPVVENPMREVVRVSNITGLEEPRLVFDVDGKYDDVTDKETAKEIELSGDTVAYGRHKVKVRAKISDTVLHGSDLNLTGEIENALRSGLAANEMARMFATAPTAGYEEMSFYSTKNAVKAVTGATKQQAIANALADLPIAYRRNAKIVMSPADWYGMWGANLNQSGTYFEDRPLVLFGKQVILMDDAADPVVGDMAYLRINYEIDTIFDVDKDVDAGIYKFVLTAWYDIKLRLKSAFRVAKVSEAAAASVNP